jgi:hypothetical protein
MAMLQRAFLMLALSLSGYVAVPVLAIEATCQVVSIAQRESDPDFGRQ